MATDYKILRGLTQNLVVVDFQQVAIKQIGDWIAEEIDKAILDELFAEIERDREIVKGIIPDKLFEV